MIAADVSPTGQLVVGVGVCLWLFLCGALVAFTPPATLLKFDRRTGAALYRYVLRRDSDEQQARRAAGRFYKVLGGSFMLVASILLLGIVASFAAAPK